jgi:hypothetical protein
MSRNLCEIESGFSVFFFIGNFRYFLCRRRNRKSDFNKALIDLVLRAV